MKYLVFLTFFALSLLSCSDNTSSNNCENQNCSNHGKCIINNNKASCQCDDGYIANNLSCIPKNTCSKNSECGEKKVCIDKQCVDELKLCDNINCGEYGNCEVKNKKALCNCNEGYIPINNTCVEDKCKNKECPEGKICNPNNGECITVNPCTNIDCGEHGTCINESGIANCKCDNLYIEKNGKCIFEIPCNKTADKDNCSDGYDNNCDGIINNECSCQSGESLECYSSNKQLIGKGECKSGTMNCIAGENWSECVGEVLPSEEICDNKDNDCDGTTDMLNGEKLFKKCYSGNIEETQFPNSRCKAGKYICNNGNYNETECVGQLLPLNEEICGNGIDDNCNGKVDEDCSSPSVRCSNDIINAYIFDSPVYLTAEITSGQDTITETKWEFSTKPQGTASELNPTIGTNTQFIPDTVGEYIAKFTVKDNEGKSAYCQTTINAKTRNMLNVTLTWDTDDTDVDLHLLNIGASSDEWGTGNDCFYANDTAEWGNENSIEDNPHLDRDDVDGFGPEVIQIKEPQNGNYTVGVHYFSDNWNGLASKATIKIICNNQTFSYEHTLEKTDDTWSVIDIVWDNDSCTLAPATRDYIIPTY